MKKVLKRLVARRAPQFQSRISQKRDLRSLPNFPIVLRNTFSTCARLFRIQISPELEKSQNEWFLSVFWPIADAPCDQKERQKSFVARLRDPLEIPIF